MYTCGNVSHAYVLTYIWENIYMCRIHNTESIISTCKYLYTYKGQNHYNKILIYHEENKHFNVLLIKCEVL